MEKKLHYESETHNRLLTTLISMIRDSQSFIAQRDDDWDHVDKQHRLYLDFSAQKRKSDRTYDSTKKEHPFGGDIVIPVSYSVLMTRADVIYSIMNQSDPFVHLEGSESDDFGPARLLEACLSRDFMLSRLPRQLWQLIIDADRYSFSVWYMNWEEEYKEVEKRRFFVGEKLSSMMKIEPTVTTEQVLTKQWANISTINPRRLLPDPAVPIGDVVERGLYLGHSEDINWLQLHEKRYSDGRGPYINVDKARSSRRTYRRNSGSTDDAGSLRDTRGNELDSKYPELEIHKVQWKIIPKDWGLSESGRMELWQFMVAGEDVIVAAYPCDSPLKKFTYGIGQLEPDMHAAFTPGMGTNLIGGHYLVNWYINSNLTNVRKMINDQLIWNDDLLNATDMKNTSPGRRIRLTQKGKLLHERGIMQIEQMYGQMRLTDVTTGHPEIAQNVFSFLQRMANTPDTVQAMPLPTKRTLGEVQGISQSAGISLGRAAGMLDTGVVDPITQQMIAYRQAYMSMEEAVKIVGKKKAAQGASIQHATREQIQGRYDYIVRTTTMPPDPARNLSMWMQIAQMVFSGQLPITAVSGKQLNPLALIEEILFQMGINYFDNFMVDSEQVQQMAPPGGEAPGVPGQGGEMKAEVMANEEIEKGVASGNMVPLT